MAAKKRLATKTKKTKSAKSTDPLERVREICLAFPESSEVEAWGEPTFRVKGKIFAMHASASTHHGAGRQAIWIMSDSTTQDLLMRARPTQYFKPPYVGPNGWVGAWLDGKPIWSEINELLRDAFRKRAPKKIAAMLPE